MQNVGLQKSILWKKYYVFTLLLWLRSTFLSLHCARHRFIFLSFLHSDTLRVREILFCSIFFWFLTDFSKSDQFWKKLLTPVLCDIFCGKFKMDYKTVSIWVYQKRSRIKKTLEISPFGAVLYMNTCLQCNNLAFISSKVYITSGYLKVFLQWNSCICVQTLNFDFF